MQLCVDWSFEKPTGVSSGYTRDTRSFGVMQESINRTRLDWGRGKECYGGTPFIMSDVIHLQICTFFSLFRSVYAATGLTRSCGAYFRSSRRYRSFKLKDGIMTFDSLSSALLPPLMSYHLSAQHCDPFT